MDPETIIVAAEKRAMAPVRDDATLMRGRAFNFPEMVRQLEIGVADYSIRDICRNFHANWSQQDTYTAY
jgi:hypothetical protein